MNRILSARMKDFEPLKLSERRTTSRNGDHLGRPLTRAGQTRPCPPKEGTLLNKVEEKIVS